MQHALEGVYQSFAFIVGEVMCFLMSLFFCTLKKIDWKLTIKKWIVETHS